MPTSNTKYPVPAASINSPLPSPTITGPLDSLKSEITACLTKESRQCPAARLTTSRSLREIGRIKTLIVSRTARRGPRTVGDLAGTRLALTKIGFDSQPEKTREAHIGSPRLMATQRWEVLQNT